MDNIKEKLYQQLAIDYCCTVSDIKDNKNHFTEYKKWEGRRQFEESDECILKVIVVNGKLVFTGKVSIYQGLRTFPVSCYKRLLHLIKVSLVTISHKSVARKEAGIFSISSRRSSRSRCP